MGYAILSFTFAILGLCAIAKPQAQNEPQKATPPQSGQQYFPIGVFEENGQLSSNKENWYSYFLTALGEPSLLEAAKANDISAYRLLLLTWNGRALSVRLTLCGDGTGLLEGKLVTFHSGKSIYAKDTVAVSTDQLQQFDSLLQKAAFWSMKTEETHAKNVYQMDGIRWVLEGTKNRTYHVVDRWSPRGTEYEKLCKFLMELSPVKLDQDVRSKNGS
jgi:hypothetical protein